jgi:ribosome-associated protein
MVQVALEQEYKTQDGRVLADQIAQAALEKNARDVVIMDLRGSTDVTDFFVICTADADTQSRAIKDSVLDAMMEQGQKPWHVEGAGDLNWLLIDFVDVVVHIFRDDARQFYGLEGIWGDAQRIEVTDG